MPATIFKNVADLFYIFLESLMLDQTPVLEPKLQHLMRVMLFSKLFVVESYQQRFTEVNKQVVN